VGVIIAEVGPLDCVEAVDAAGEIAAVVETAAEEAGTVSPPVAAGVADAAGAAEEAVVASVPAGSVFSLFFSFGQNPLTFANVASRVATSDAMRCNPVTLSFNTNEKQVFEGTSFNESDLNSAHCFPTHTSRIFATGSDRSDFLVRSPSFSFQYNVPSFESASWKRNIGRRTTDGT